MIIPGPDVRGLQGHRSACLILHAAAPLLVAWIVQVLVDGRDGAKVNKVGGEAVDRRLRLCLSGRRPGNDVGIAVASGKVLLRDGIHKRRREARVGNGVQEDVVIGDSITAANYE